jgi:hypothetical protein
MDKETLSNYGWIVVAILVLTIMIAMATPFGKYIANAVENTAEGLFNVQQNALSAVGLEIPDQVFWKAQNGAQIFYDRVYARDDGTTAGIWHRDGSMTIVMWGDVKHIPASEVSVDGNRVWVNDPFCPGEKSYSDATGDGSLVSMSMWYYYDYDEATQTYGSKEFAHMEDVPITEYTSIEAWLATQNN